MLSGKTEWTKKLLLNMDALFVNPPGCVIYMYKHWQSAYDQLQQAIAPERLQFLSNIPAEEELAGLVSQVRGDQTTTAPCLIVVDDYMDEICTNPLFLNLLTRSGHHMNLVNLFIVQDGTLFGSYKRQILRNIHTTVYMSSARDRAGLRNLAILLNDYQCIMQAFDDVARGQWVALNVCC